MFKTLKKSVVISFVLIISVLTVNAADVVLNVDGNWHDLQQVSIYTSATSTDIGVNTTWSPSWNSVQTLPYSVQAPNQQACYIGIPLRGEDWQVNANEALEIRFNLSLYSSVNDTKYYRNFAQVVMPGTKVTPEGTDYPVWWGANTLFYVSKKGTTMSSYVAPTTGQIDVYRSLYGGETETTAEGLTFYKYGYLYDIVIPAGWLKSTTRTIYIPIDLAVTYNDIVHMSYAKVRSVAHLSDYEILTSILTAIQGIEGMTPAQMQQAVYNALKQFNEEQQTQTEQEAQNNEAAINSAVDTIKQKFNIETIKNAYQPYIDLITSTETEDFVLHVPETTVNLSGHDVKLIPEITYNVTAEVKKLDNAAANVSAGSTAGWTTLKTLIGAIISISVCTGTVLTIKSLITSVTSGFVKEGTKNE